MISKEKLLLPINPLLYSICVIEKFSLSIRKAKAATASKAKDSETFSSIDIKLPEQKLFYSMIGTYANTDDVIAKFFKLLSLLTQMASIRTIVWRLADEVKKTQRRVNALDKMVIPQTLETKQFIENALEEKERENVFVLKALKKKNERKRQEEEDE